MLLRLPYLTPKTEPTEPPQTDVQAIRAKLDHCAAEIQAAEAELRRVGVNAVIGDDPAAGLDVVARLQALRSRHELLRAALEGAEAAEADARAATTEREWQARKRAISQHVARLERTARAVSDAEGALITEFNKMQEAGASLVAALPASMRSNAQAWHELLGPYALREMAAVEAFRQEHNGTYSAKLFRPAPTAGIEDRETGAIPTLAARLTEIIGTLRRNLELAAPTPSRPLPANSATSVATAEAVLSSALESAPADTLEMTVG